MDRFKSESIQSLIADLLQVFETVSMIDVWAIKEQQSSVKRAASRAPNWGDQLFNIEFYGMRVTKAEMEIENYFIFWKGAFSSAGMPLVLLL